MLGVSDSFKATTGASVYTNPPVKTFEYSQSVRGAKVTASRRMTCLHYASAHEQWYVNANKLTVQQTSRAPHQTLRVTRGGRSQLTDEQDDVVVGDV